VDEDHPYGSALRHDARDAEDAPGEGQQPKVADQQHRDEPGDGRRPVGTVWRHVGRQAEAGDDRPHESDPEGEATTHHTDHVNAGEDLAGYVHPSERGEQGSRQAGGERGHRQASQGGQLHHAEPDSEATLMLADIANGNVDWADIFFLIAVILFVVGAAVAYQMKALWATAVALGLGFVALAWLLL
jgi:hypothetical protein